MLTKISSSYYFFSQVLFQDPFSRFSHPLSSASFSWGKKSTLLQWFNLLRVPFCSDLFPASPDFGERKSGPRKKSQRLFCARSSIPCRFGHNRCSSLSWMIPSLKKRERKFQDEPGIRTILRRPMFLVTNGSSLPCSIRTFFNRSGLNSIILRGPKDAGLSGLKSPWLKRWFKLFSFLFLVKSIFWRIAGIGQSNWFSFAESVATI